MSSQGTHPFIDVIGAALLKLANMVKRTYVEMSCIFIFLVIDNDNV
jgi:hypothetical protein